MEEKRTSYRYNPSCLMVITHALLGRFVGYIRNMSDSGAFVAVNSCDNFYPSLLVNAKIIGEGWDDSSKLLPMEVVRIDDSGVALKFSHDSA